MDEERTEQASPRKRQQARQRGEAPRSKELTDALNLLAGLLALWYLMAYSLSQTRFLYSDAFTSLATKTYTVAQTDEFFIYLIARAVMLTAPFMVVVFLVTGLANLAQSGFILAPSRLEPRLDRLSPMTGLKRVFSMRGTVETVKNVLKMIVAGWIVYAFLVPRWAEIAAAATLDPWAFITLFGRMVFDLGLRLVAFLLLLAIVDYFYQRYEFEKSIRMSKTEVKEELKQTEGDPLIRRRLRERARQIAMTRMLAEVPQADVVITNPTHYAVALKYETELGAPMVVAKGVNAVALRIREIALAHGVAVEENPELAQTLWRAVEIGEQIPFELYEVVAAILAKVYRSGGNLPPGPPPR